MSVRRKHVDNNNMWAVDREGISGGLLLLWNDKIKVNVLSWSKGHIHAILAGQNFLPWFFTGFYGHPVPSLRSQSWDLLQKLEKDIYGAWICGGDFNEIVGNEEKFGGMQRSYVAMNNFKEVLNECKLIDFGKVKGEMTWRNDVVMERLDRCLCNWEWLNIFPNAKVSVLDWWCSDHRPLKHSHVSSGKLKRRVRLKVNFGSKGIVISHLFFAADTLVFMEANRNENTSRDKFEVFVAISWQIWISRNKVLHGEKIPNVEDLVEWCYGYVADFRKQCEPITEKYEVVTSKWDPPLHNCLKINVDASISAGGVGCGVAAVLRDECGKVIQGRSVYFHRAYKPLVAELYAIKEGILLAKDLDISNFSVESDCANALLPSVIKQVVAKKSGSFVRKKAKNLGASIRNKGDVEMDEVVKDLLQIIMAKNEDENIVK
ncbi:hypothetical protein POM88_047641 [Heracleum sosnowskyi]|uniref:RNase H type-1 domain-containing protein n=1 Tax=Heracleum sosnowskyi TaxID=360622 RepID=A0AAD8GUJ5_9APIA|nr:hypothetical protein POM88_047641 [Heracleum sosnowskyi]